MRQGIRFLLGDAPRELAEVDPTLTILEYLRLRERRMGTKEGCAEGDCGACTVVVGRPEGGRMRYAAVNACIGFVPMLDGAQLLTVEDLSPRGGPLHPVQDAIVRSHGSQCGFCTPGFVMSLWTLWRRGEAATPAMVDDLFAGNLCRCTGYGPLAVAALSLPADSAPADAIVAQEPETVRLLERWAEEPGFAVAQDGRRFAAPAGAGELAALLLEEPSAVILGGATDVGLWVTKQDRRLQSLIWLGRCADLQAITDAGGHLAIGAAVTYRDATAAIAGLYPDAGELLRRLGSVQIRNAGTIGGNIANGSPIGDMPPFLIAAGARLVLRLGRERRTLPLEDFFIAYGRQDRAAGEFVEAVLLPKPAPGSLFRCWKIAKRFDQDISAVCGAFNFTLAEGRVADARIAFGGMAATPRRPPRAEAALTGEIWGEPAVRQAMAALDEDFKPINDFRASAAYRSQVAKNLLRKCWLEHAGEKVAVAAPRSPAFV